MSLAGHLSRRPGRRGRSAFALAVVSLALAVAALVALADGTAVAGTWRAARSSPATVVLALGSFAAAFVLRAVAWRRVLPRLPFGQAWAAIHVALAGNHVLPLRLGEPLRVTSAVRRAGVPVADAAASTLVLRSADTVAVVALALLGAPRVVAGTLGGWGWALLAATAVAGLAGWRWLRRLATGSNAGAVRLPGVVAFATTALAWAFEAVLVAVAAAWAGIALDPVEALAVTSVSVAAQVAAVAPGGLGTYEAAATAAYVGLGFPAEAGLAAALAAHAVKTLYSLAVGAVALVAPAPGMLGRFRLARVAFAAGAGPGSAGDGPVVLVLPAHDEEATVGAVVRRVPATAAGRPVRCLVVDDGSADRTAERAREAGATVVRLNRNRGLGAAVRVGFAEALALGASVVAFCDADGEYAPEELSTLVAPVLAGTADYVVGSRFAGRPERMLPHRRLGNVVLTRVLRLVARAPITDGQSGYRALSARAAADAEIVHDYNYAQVLTLDLLAKGYRYAEVPISYRFRSEGRSFVRLLPYLRRVVPAVWRELNTA